LLRQNGIARGSDARVEPDWELGGKAICSARLQAGIVDSSTCPPAAADRRHKNQDCTIKQSSQHVFRLDLEKASG